MGKTSNFLDKSTMKLRDNIQIEITETKTEQNVDESDEEPFNTMSLFQLSRIIQKSQDPLEFNSTDAMMDPNSNQQLVCMLCYKNIDPNDLTDHMIGTHNYRRVLFKCHNCNSTFQERTLLTVHKDNCEIKAKKQKKLNFQQILREVESKEFLEDRVENVTCPICMIDVSKFHLKGHLLSKHKKIDEEQSCAICDRKFKTKMTLKGHVKLVHEAEENSAQCNLCGQKFGSAKYLQNHKRNVHPSGNKVHLCDICGKEFKSHLCLHQHTRHVHPHPSAAVDCPHCHQTFKCGMNLRQHTRVAHGIGKQKKI